MTALRRAIADTAPTVAKGPHGDEARADVLDHIKIFYTSTRQYARTGMLSPVELPQTCKAYAERLYNNLSGSLGCERNIERRSPIIAT